MKLMVVCLQCNTDSLPLCFPYVKLHLYRDFTGNLEFFKAMKHSIEIFVSVHRDEKKKHTCTRICEFFSLKRQLLSN